MTEQENGLFWIEGIEDLKFEGVIFVTGNTRRLAISFKNSKTYHAFLQKSIKSNTIRIVGTLACDRKVLITGISTSVKINTATIEINKINQM